LWRGGAAPQKIALLVPKQKGSQCEPFCLGIRKKLKQASICALLASSQFNFYNLSAHFHNALLFSEPVVIGH
jgi:hypothetical protein